MVFLLHTVLLPDAGYGSIKAILSLGHLGVDLFFTLSGFLITGILYKAKDNTHYFRNFYARRTLRIFPLYYFYLVAYYVLVIRLHIVNFGADKAAQAASDLHWAWLYGTNLEIARTGEFITTSINQFWTLAVEEHFYLLWPLLIYWLSRRGILLGAALISVGSLGLRLALQAHGASPHAILVFTPCRMDSFAIGGAASVLLTNSTWRTRSKRWAAPTVIIAGVLVLGIYFGWHGEAYQTIGYTLTSIFFASLITFCVLHETAPVSQAFSSATLRFLGKYSYAMYLFHAPILIFVSRKLPLAKLVQHTHSIALASAMMCSLVGVLSIGAALLTWNLFEKRFLRLKRYFPESARRDLPCEVLLND